MAENNKEIITLIGRRLREAADAGQSADLPEAIRLGLQRLGGLGSSPLGEELTPGTGGNGVGRKQQETASEEMQPLAE